MSLAQSRMRADEFREKWKRVELTERAACQSHFNDLCDVLGVPQPVTADPTGESYRFEKAVKKPDGSQGYADAWKRHCFAWEYKKDKKNLVQAYRQLKDYADALENPPLLIVSDMDEIRIHTNFTNTVAEQIVVPLARIGDPEVQRKLRWAFQAPERLMPTATREQVTQDAAKAFGVIAGKLRRDGYDSRRVAHFLNKLVFCMFVEDIELLPDNIFADVIEESLARPEDFQVMLGDLFAAMREKGGRFGTIRIPWFNGGLFDDDDVLPLSYFQIRDVAEAARLDWSNIEPSIFGTLFEKGLDPQRRKEMASLFDGAEPDRVEVGTPTLFDKDAPDKAVGVHYTHPDTIMKLVEPAVLRPLELEWAAVKAEIEKHRATKAKAKSAGARTKAENAARDAYRAFRRRLGAYRVLDPACGSGNFLYLSLLHLKDFDLRVAREAEVMGLPADDQRVGPEAVLGIEINPYAAELARVTIWIGEIQWQMRNAFGIRREPILGQLDGIECRDALLNPDGSEARWPEADAIVGNPPFLGGKRMISGLGEGYVERLFAAFKGRVPAEADLVTYWFVKAGEAIRQNRAEHAGLVATNSIRGGANRRAVQAALGEELALYEAWDDEPWVLDGAAVRVSLLAYGWRDDATVKQRFLDGQAVEEIYTNLTAKRGGVGVDVTSAVRLHENAGVAFMGDTKGGSFDVPGDLARKWLEMPANPNGRPNSDVLRPWANGMDVTRRPRDMWIIDFGWEMNEQDAAYYEAPFRYVREKVRKFRLEKNDKGEFKVRREAYRTYWWRHMEPRPKLRGELARLDRYIATTRVARYRLFSWLDARTIPDSRLIVIIRDDDVTLGILHSRFHELWSLGLGGWHGVGNDPQYTPTEGFEKFPFPEGLTPDNVAADYADDPRAQAIAAAATELDEKREAWLNPPELVDRVPEVVPGYPDRIVPKGEKAAKELKKRTLTNLYNERPTWLDNLHRALDEAVAEAYGWPADLSDEEVLARLLALNHERAAAQGE